MTLFLSTATNRVLTALILAFLLAPTIASAAPCSPEKLAEALSPAGTASRPLSLDCDLKLPRMSTVSRPLLFEGKAASGATLDCNGGHIAGNGKADSIVIRSAGSDWQAMADNRPSNVTIRDCQIEGSIRVYGLGPNGQAEKVRQSSLSLGHTERAQAAAPTAITLQGLNFTTLGRIPVYLGPGVTGVTIASTSFAGRLAAPAIYLDAESGHNIIRGNDFAMVDTSREVIAVDGSAGNTIADNIFRHVDNGGIFLYRNCGEGGTVRHQSPTGNVISRNMFMASVKPYSPTIWLGSRGGGLLSTLFSYCSADRGYPFGSSADDGDEANGNEVGGNVFIGLDPATAIRDNGRDNRIADNRAGR